MYTSPISSILYGSGAPTKLRHAAYFVGAPDPYRILEIGEVYIHLPNEKAIADPYNRFQSEFRDTHVITGDVIVSRFPMYHPGDFAFVFCLLHVQMQKAIAHEHIRNKYITYYILIFKILILFI